MPKKTYVPTEADRVTGQNVRNLRRRAGETLADTLKGSGLDLGMSSLSRIELGERPLSLPEATKLAAHFGTTAEKIIAKPATTEQEWLGNQPTELFAVPGRADKIEAELAAASGNWITINQDAPLTPEQYRDQVWIPYLEANFAKAYPHHKQTG